MRTRDESAERVYPDWPWPRVTALRGLAAKLRRHGYGPVSARYLAAHLALEDVLSALFAVDELTPEAYDDGGLERHCQQLVREAGKAVEEAMLRHLQIEVRHLLAGRRLARAHDPKFYMPDVPVMKLHPRVSALVTPVGPSKEDNHDVP